MNKKTLAIIFTICSCICMVPSALADDLDSAANQAQISINRLSGQTKFETAKIISEYYANGKVNNVILSTGIGFADALSASVLAHEKDAPILLVDSKVGGSKDAFDYIVQHLDPTGTVYIIGGTGIIGTEFETKLSDLGFNQVVRLAGLDKYATSYTIADSLPDIPDSTVVISSGEQYSDALSFSSFAANKGWPILLSPREALPQEMKNFLLERRPSKVYIAGGTGIISDSVQADISSLLPGTYVQRLMGQSRFDTNVIIAEAFAPNPATVYLATGSDFADALAGSTVAAKQGDPIIFIDPSEPTLPKLAAGYLENLYANNLAPNVVAFGGSRVVSDEIIKNSRDLLAGTVKGTTIYSVADLTAAVTQNDSYALPSTVPARLYNSDTINLPVQWSPNVVDTSKVGQFSYGGVVNANGYSKAIKLTLNVSAPLPIAQYITYFDPGLANRTENIRLAAKAIDGKLLAPGEQFSFNGTVGERTAEAGYKDAYIINGDSYELGLGGGICQVSSTLYNAVSLAHLQVIERHSHSLPVSYVPSGQDATVSYGILDFKFKNSTDAYLLIRSFIDGNTLTSQLYREVKN